MFIQPRDFVTYCRHRWLNNGRVQFITNQACEHTSSSNDDDDSDDNDDATTPTSSKYRAYSLRGATLISPCSSTLQDNEEQQEQEQEKEIECTTIIMLSHCNCGNDIPEWAVRTAVGILAPIKPFEIIHRIEIGIQNARYELDQAEEESAIKMKSSSSSSSIMKKATASSLSSSSSLSWSSDDDDDERGKKRIITRRRSSRPAGIAQMGYGAFWPDGGGLLDEEDNDDDMEENLYFDETI